MTTARTHLHPAIAPTRIPLPAWVATLLREIGVGR